MLNFIGQQLSALRPCFSRAATFQWFLIVVIGMLTRYDFLGVTSIIRSLNLHPGCYEKMLHFFRSKACDNTALKKAWIRVVKTHATFSC